MFRHPSWRKRLLFWGVAVIGGLVALNLLAWPFAPKESVFWENPLMAMYPVEGFDTSMTIDQLSYSDEPDRVVRYVPDSQRWYRLDDEPTIPAQGKVVLNFGDSSTWGWGLPDRKYAYPTALNRYLPTGVHSVNLGVPGYSSVQGLRYVAELVPKHHQRVVAITLYFGNNDAVNNGMPDIERMRRQPSILTKLSLYRLMARWIPVQLKSRNELPQVSPGEYQRNLKRIVAIARSYDIPVVVIVPPIRLTYLWPPGHATRLLSLESVAHNQWSQGELVGAQWYYRKGVELVGRRDSDCYEPFLQEALEHDWLIPRIKSAWLAKLNGFDSEPGVAVVPIGLVMTKYSIEAESFHFVDYCHPNAFTHRRIAEQVAEAMGD